MPAYKLRYFSVRGRAEVTRWLFAHAGAEYVDDRISYADEWKTMKDNIQDFPFKQLPVLEVVSDDGKKTVIAQSHAVARFVANEFGLFGKTSLNKARCDMIVEHIFSAIQTLPWVEKDEEKKATLMKEAVEGPVGEHFKLLENLVQESGYLVGDEITLADIDFAASCEFITPTCPDALDGFPKLKALNEKVRKSDRIAKWIAERPVTHM